ncbi:MFS transporter [Ectobacillus ponti]|uniref:MFS transporter n=1 Tax=Ectobacillus ponti TaxID=2961894 RepID=A0AA42BNC7_9BACI|nr:MFS transporter [Ectobacillus ponti]MCP8967527.1 MFS transporter [Ectobacillus ponti]
MDIIERKFYSKARFYSFLTTLVLVFVVWYSTDQFVHIDLATLGYLLGSIVFAIGMVIRVCFWFARPATSQVVKRSIHNLKSADRVKRNLLSIVKTGFENIFLQKFIFKRGLYRGVQHFLIAWGCIGSLAFTMGLVFGLFRFSLIDADTYGVIMFNHQVIQIKADGVLAELMYNSLNMFAMMLLIGATMALIRRTINKDVRVTQRFEFDILPLLLLLGAAVTGLALTVSYVFLGGFFHPELRLIHEVEIVLFLVYFPFGKLFHVPIRPLATAVPMNYQEVVKVDTRACKKCSSPYSNDDQIQDVKEILAAQQFDLQLADGTYLADYCPACRRRIRVMKQLNMGAPLGDPYGPIQTINGIHIPGFGQKRAEEFYGVPKQPDEETVSAK